QAACARGRKPASKSVSNFGLEKSAVAAYAGKEKSEYDTFERRAAGCTRIRRENAREVEGTMSGQWKSVVYSAGVKVGDSVFIFGQGVRTVPVRETADDKAPVAFKAPDRTRVKVLAKGPQAGEDVSGFWFQLSFPDGRKGWVFGRYVHPDPDSLEPYIQNP